MAYIPSDTGWDSLQIGDELLLTNTFHVRPGVPFRVHVTACWFGVLFLTAENGGSVFQAELDGARSFRFLNSGIIYTWDRAESPQ